MKTKKGIESRKLYIRIICSIVVIFILILALFASYTHNKYFAAKSDLSSNRGFFLPNRISYIYSPCNKLESLWIRLFYRGEVYPLEGEFMTDMLAQTEYYHLRGRNDLDRLILETPDGTGVIRITIQQHLVFCV